MKAISLLLLLDFFSFLSLGQVDSTLQKLKFTADFRFRIEQDWESRKPDGSFRADRSRMRYRFRFGLNYQLDKHSSFGARIRTGNASDQQGPHLTLGGNTGEFGLAQMGLEKLFYQVEYQGLKGWLGKNSILLHKENELFWNDNVFPDGLALQYQLPLKENKFLSALQFNAGHFIVKSNHKSFSEDRYFQMIQLASRHFKERLNLFAGFYYFNELGNIPDNQETFTLSYSIFHIGNSIKILKKQNLSLGVEYYTNLQDYDAITSIPSDFKNEKNGWVLNAKWGGLKKKGDWQLHFYYTQLEKYAIVDYFAQNDWARWDYSSADASGSRISNFKGMEIRLGYAFREKFNLILRTYFVEQLLAEGTFTETGNRIRLDLNIGF